MKPAVYNSKAAQKDMDKISATHSELVQGIADQAVRVQQYNQQKQAELAQQNAMKMEMDKQNMAYQSETMKTNIDAELRRAEIDIKRAAISSK